MDQKPKRGLSALLASTTQQGASSPARQATMNLLDIQIYEIRPSPNQPRAHFDPDALRELADSIKERGLIQPLVVRELRAEEVSGGARYELIAGERRWRAAQMAALPSVPAIVKQVFDSREILLLSLVENLQRDDLNPVEEALAYQRLASTFSLTHEQIAQGVGKSRATVSNTLRLLELPSSVVDALKTRRLSIAHALFLLRIPDPQIQTQLAAKVQAEDLTVKDLERLVAGNAGDESRPALPRESSREKGSRNTRHAPTHLQDAEQKLREHFGTRVNVEESLRKGKIIIEFYSVEDFERIVALMGIE